MSIVLHDARATLSGDSWQAMLDEHVGFATLSVPTDTYTVTNLSNSGDGSLRDALSSPNRKVTVTPGLQGNIVLLTEDGRRPEAINMADNVWFDGRGSDLTLTAGGINVPGRNCVIRNLKGRANGPSNRAPDFIGVKGTARNIWLRNLTGTGEGDKVGDGFIDVADGARSVDLYLCRTDNWDKNHSFNDGSTDVSVILCMWRGGQQRHPKNTNGSYCHMLNCWIDGWASYGAASTDSGKLLVESCIFDRRGNSRAVRCINALGDPDGFVRDGGGNLHADARIETNRPDNVPNPPYSYTKRTADQGLREFLEANAGWQAS